MLAFRLFWRQNCKHFKQCAYYNTKMSNTEIMWPKVVLFGDSLTQRSFEPKHGLWGALLADRLQRIADVVCRGFSGYNTEMCRKILPQIFSNRNVSDIAAFLICLGANDSSCKASNQHVPVDEFTENLIFMVNYLKEGGLSGEKILLVTPPPHDSETFIQFLGTSCKETVKDVPLRNGKLVPEYVKAVHVAGNTCNVDVIDLNAAMSKDENWKSYFCDGLHFSHSGSKKAFETIWPHVANRVDADNLLFPLWSDFAEEFQEVKD